MKKYWSAKKNEDDDIIILVNSIHNISPMQVFLTTSHILTLDLFLHPPTVRPHQTSHHIFPLKLHNLFRLFFLASIFFFSACAFVKPASFFSVVLLATVDAAVPPTLVSTTEATIAG